jgi:hypothetical protein
VMTSMMSRALTICCLVAPALGMQGLITASRPAVRAPCTADRRCAPLRAQHGDEEESRIDIDDFGGECFITNAGASCLGADDSSIDMPDGLDVEPPLHMQGEGRQRRSPGLINNFVSSSTEDFKKPYVPPSEVAEPALNGLDREPRQQAPQSDERGQRRSPGLAKTFVGSSTEDFKKPYIPPSEVAEHAVAAARGTARGASGRTPAAFPVFSSHMPSYICVPSP